ncbi:hypothetical protein CEXT_241341 [Caerostris extrusa]|uniref:C2H2-type domain-containing protein n=1 Tax=Caerostris extrusa TaxID=172846 RepID=A0AAV4WVR0_CAEEX|nr:hypothetical protein CEXT_241341 [Caerostris extrusa]
MLRNRMCANFCDKAFTESGTLVKHIRSHTGENHLHVVNAVKGIPKISTSNVTCLNTLMKTEESAILAAMNSPLRNLLDLTSVGRLNKVVLRGMPSERVVH